MRGFLRERELSSVVVSQFEDGRRPIIYLNRTQECPLVQSTSRTLPPVQRVVHRKGVSYVAARTAARAAA